jgi:AcrR family transcriptional regulator
MSETLTPEKILETAEDVLRRYGPAKATVVDVARALGVSHGSVYRHFPSKAALRDAVTERWLKRVSDPLEKIVQGEGPAPDRLRDWIDALIATKRAKVGSDPELFATYQALIDDSRDVVVEHVNTLAGQASRIIADGVGRGEFAVDDPEAAARAMLTATLRFHHPSHASGWLESGIDEDFEGVWRFVLAGLGAKPGQG